MRSAIAESEARVTQLTRSLDESRHEAMRVRETHAREKCALDEAHARRVAELSAELAELRMHHVSPSRGSETAESTTRAAAAFAESTVSRLL